MNQEAFNKEIDPIYKEFLHTDIFCLVDVLNIIEKYGIYSDANKKKVLKSYNPNICPSFITFFCDIYGFIQQYDSIRTAYNLQINKLNDIIDSHIIKEKEYIDRIINLDLLQRDTQSVKQSGVQGSMNNIGMQKGLIGKPYYKIPVKSSIMGNNWSRMSQSNSQIENKILEQENNALKEREKMLLQKIEILEKKIKNAITVCDNIIE